MTPGGFLTVCSWLIKTFVFVIRLNTSFIYLGRGVPTSLAIRERRSRRGRCLCVPNGVTVVGVFYLLRHLLEYVALLASAFLCQSPYWELRGLCAGII